MGIYSLIFYSMEANSKFSCGDQVFLFNGLTCEIESDFVFAVLYAPVLKAGATGAAEGQALKEKIDSGDMEVKEQYQTCTHGVIGANGLFGSEKECKEYYLKFFSE